MTASFTSADCRTALNELIREALPWSPGLVGRSRSLARLTGFIAQAGNLDLPVLILGEFGSQVEEVAYAIHAVREGRRAFQRVDCGALTAAGLRDRVPALHGSAVGGTLFLARVNALAAVDQGWLARRLQGTMNRWIGAEAGRAPRRARIVASIESGGEDASRNLDPRLLGELDFLRFRLPPLRERPEDIRPLAVTLLERLTGEREDALSEEAWGHVEQYHWPGNFLELRCVIARLSSLIHERPIPPHAIARWASPLLEGRNGSGPRSVPPPSDAPEVVDGNGLPAERAAGDLQRLLVHCSRGRVEGCRIPHSRLRRALDFIASNFQRKVGLADVASGGHLSASHLSHLFRDYLGVSPMRFVAMVRLERAAALLAEEADRSITEVAGVVGFGDLRHFERQFKRRFGACPSSYRRDSHCSGSSRPEDPPY